jgi:hypothetical protein
LVVVTEVGVCALVFFDVPDLSEYLGEFFNDGLQVLDFFNFSSDLCICLLQSAEDVLVIIS